MALPLAAPVATGLSHGSDGLAYDLKTPIDDMLTTLGLGLTGSVAVAGDVLPIPLTAKHVAKTTAGDAEALTLADGFEGQVITVTLATDGGGDGTLAPATATGFTSVVLADAGDNATFQFIDSTVGWVIIGTAGVLAPPVIVA